MAGRPLTTPDVGQQATDFAQRIETLLQNVLGGNDDGYVAEPEGMSLRAGRTGYRITQRDARGVSLNSDGEKVAGLSFRFHCSCRNENSWLQIDKSVVMVTAEPDGVWRRRGDVGWRRLAHGRRARRDHTGARRLPADPSRACQHHLKHRIKKKRIIVSPSHLCFKLPQMVVGRADSFFFGALRLVKEC